SRSSNLPGFLDRRQSHLLLASELARSQPSPVRCQAQAQKRLLYSLLPTRLFANGFTLNSAVFLSTVGVPRTCLCCLAVCSQTVPWIPLIFFSHFPVSVSMLYSISRISPPFRICL